MIHELKNIVQQARADQERGVKSVLATVVHLAGSSYRRPGVRMLLSQDGQLTGAISGGCVEKEMFRRAKSVFETGCSKIAAYDGRYRLGCEGILYVLLEPWNPQKSFYRAFDEMIVQRASVSILSWYEAEDECTGRFGSMIKWGNKSFQVSRFFDETACSSAQLFEQNLAPCFRLFIIGAGHDAEKLSAMAAMLGWEIDIIASEKSVKTIRDFPGARSFTATSPEVIQLNDVNKETAVVLMTHNYALDLKYLLKLQNADLRYLGVLGSTKRRNKLQDELIEMGIENLYAVLDKMHCPAGLNLGAETPEEIALSILSEILAVKSKREPFSLTQLTHQIHG